LPILWLRPVGLTSPEYLVVFDLTNLFLLGFSMGEILIVERDTRFSRVLVGLGAGASYPKAISGGAKLTSEPARSGSEIKLPLTPIKIKLIPIAAISFFIMYPPEIYDNPLVYHNKP
jgi:hypothetical protein